MDRFIDQWFGHWGVWLRFGAYLLATVLIAWVGKYLARGIIRRLAARGLGDELSRGGEAPVRLAILALGFRISLQVLHDGIATLAAATWFGWIERISAALVILAVTALINGLLKAGLNWYIHSVATGNEAWDKELLPVIRWVITGVLSFIALSIILKQFGQDITALVTTAGVASLAVALAAQETLSNMLGGFTILVDRPFKVGDLIELADGRAGEVLKIGIRSTRIKQGDGTLLVVPNKDMANSRVINYALPTTQVAIRATVTLDMTTDVERAKQVLLGVMQAHPEVMADPAPGVYLVKLGPGTLELALTCWVASYKERLRIADELNMRWLKALRMNGIRVPHPQQDLHLNFLEDRLAPSPGGGSPENGEA